jgi:hypothetical protein
MTGSETTQSVAAGTGLGTGGAGLRLEAGFALGGMLEQSAMAA